MTIRCRSSLSVLAVLATLAILAVWAFLAIASPAVATASSLEFVQTWPIEADELRDPDMREAHVVWAEMIAGAQRDIRLAHFYASNQPDSRLEPIVRALEAAAARGVRIHFLADAGFHRTYPETLDRLGAVEGIELRLFDLRALTGGVLHAKYMVVDEDQVFVGSQNFDWRALEHIQELGAHVVDSAIAAEFRAVFEADWRRAGGETVEGAAVDSDASPRTRTLDFGGESVSASAVFSPRDLLSDGTSWDLPQILRLLDAAQQQVRVQLLNYKAISRDRSYWPQLENALRAAAARGVRVELLVSHWSQRKFTIEGLQSLQCLPNVEVRILTPPEYSGGFIPFARVIHAKYLVVDDHSAWVGTSNWQRDYFYASRNAGIVIEGAGPASALNRYFQRNWSSPYSQTVDPSRSYPAPRVSE